MRIVQVRHENQMRPFLFSTPVDIKAEEKLLVNTMRGEATATAVTDSVEVPENALPIIAQMVGAYLPLAPVIGRYEPFGKPEYREVKRDAIPGDKIKIVNAVDCDHDEYKNGDILTVVSRSAAAAGDGRAYYKDQIWKYAKRDEYVVLEEVTP